MSPLELPGLPLGSRSSKNKVSCPKCGKEYSNKALIVKMTSLKVQEIKLKCKKCECEFTYQKP